MTRGSSSARSRDTYDVLAVDAFSSDAIPMHLMTREAFDVYDRVVRDDGLVLVHITNRFIDLEPVLRALVSDGGWSAAVRATSRPRRTPGLMQSQSSIGSRSRAPLARSTSQLDEVGGDWQPLGRRAGSGPGPTTSRRCCRCSSSRGRAADRSGRFGESG